MSKLLKTALLLCGVAYAPFCIAQNQLVGQWTNSYGSLLTIQSQSKGTLKGIYASSTGSTGKYKVVGTYAPSSSTGSVSVALTILWSSIDGSTKDPSQFWTSVMVGAYYSEKGVMELINQIAAAEAFAAVSVEEPGVYPESLTFTKKKDLNKVVNRTIQPSTLQGATGARHNAAALTAYPSASPQSRATTPALRNSKSAGLSRGLPRKVISDSRLDGTWQSREGNLTIKINVTKNDLSASIDLNGKTFSAIGLAADPGKGFQALAIASSPWSADSTILGIAGLLDVGGDELRLVISEARSVAYKNKYAATSLNIFDFERVSP